jgi:hypothetical protein
MPSSGVHYGQTAFTCWMPSSHEVFSDGSCSRGLDGSFVRAAQSFRIAIAIVDRLVEHADQADAARATPPPSRRPTTRAVRATKRPRRRAGVDSPVAVLRAQAPEAPVPISPNGPGLRLSKTQAVVPVRPLACAARRSATLDPRLSSPTHAAGAWRCPGSGA